MTKLTFIGGGSTGHCGAAIFALKGFDTTICDVKEYQPRFDDIKEKGGILLRSDHICGLAQVTTTTDFGSALAGAKVIFINVIASRHEEIASLIAPHLSSGQHIIISPGNLGSFVFRKVFKEKNVTAQVTVSELEGNLFPCRLTGKAEALIGLPFRKKNIASLPKEDTPRVVEELADVMELAANRDVLESALNSTNFVMHLGATLFSVSSISRRKEKFNMFQEGLSEHALVCSEAAEMERRAVMETLNLVPHDNPLDFMNRLMAPEDNPELARFMTLGGPDSVHHRYITEDALCAGALCVSVAKEFGFNVSVLESMVTLGGVVNHINFLETGRTLKNLDLSGMSIDEILSSI